MKVKIAAFGTKQMINRLARLALDYEELEILPLVYEKVEETEELIESVFMSDVYLFCDPLSFKYAEEKIAKKRLATVTVEFDPFALSTSFYPLEQRHLNQRVAIDVTHENYLKETLAGLDIKEYSTLVYVHDPYENPNIDKLVSHYEELWRRGKVSYVLSSTEEVTKRLKENSIPCSTLKIPDFNLVKALEESISLAKLTEVQNKQIVTGYVSVKGLEHGDDATSQYTDQVLTKLRHTIENFSNKTDATYVQTSDDTFMIIGTDKILRHLKEHYREFPLLQELKSTMKLPIYLGFGLGLNVKEATNNAKLALGACMKSDHSICYIVNERQEMIGPIGIKKEIDTSSLYHALIHEAKLNNELSYNFIDFIKERNNEPFSTNDVAQFYQVTKRSAERTVNKLLGGNVIKVSGKERPYTKGRPRKLFTLNQ